MTSDKRGKINIIAPALRALTGDGDRFKLVSFSDTSAAETDLLRLACPEDDASPRAIVEKIRKTLKNSRKTPRCISVDGIGYFHVHDTPCTAGRVAGKVSLVTGAAQGIGKEIAAGFAREGALVFLADINADGVEETAAEINRAHNEQRAFPVEVNVTEEESVAQAIHYAVRQAGGIDVLIANAGVLRADSVKHLPLRDFHFVTEVNYTGYFLCVQQTAPVMSVQHLANPDVWADIIQINSKSGLTGSNRNPAYAGSKFGAIGLTQSFALELVEDGIKVNAVCPGNFLDSPLWSDPENGLFVQYLRAGKVPGAESIADVRKAYEAKVPMGRGCQPEDAMKSIYYLIEQDYETGQAVPVTGGQVMLH